MSKNFTNSSASALNTIALLSAWRLMPWASRAYLRMCSGNPLDILNSNLAWSFGNADSEAGNRIGSPPELLT